MYIRLKKKRKKNTTDYTKVQFLRTANVNIERESRQKLLLKTSFHEGLSFEK